MAEAEVGILGAGVGGLYTAMILEDLGISYRILEARRRVGGRLFTYNFPTSLSDHDYFDVGAMRFPGTGAMNRVFDLFENDNLNTPDINLVNRIIPFYFRGGAPLRPFLYYNNVRRRQPAQGAQLAANTFLPNQVLQAGRNAYIAARPEAIVNDVIRPFATLLLDDLARNRNFGWRVLKHYDAHSTRSYMTFQYKPTILRNPVVGINPAIHTVLGIGAPNPPIPNIPQNAAAIPDQHIPTDVVNWCETFDKSTGWYDRAFSETVLEAIAFGWTPNDPNGIEVPWFCVRGGSQKISDAMATYIKNVRPNAISFDKRVTAIKVNDDNETIAVTANGRDHNFSHVISTIPLPVLRTIDLSGAGLNPKQSNALRDLTYGPSVKIGMQFRTAWWNTGIDRNNNILGIVGGQTYTDRPLRTVVYPSYPSLADIEAGRTTTLIASYCWTEDANRLGALVDNDDRHLAEVVLKELADIHNVDIEFLRNELVDIKGWSWSHDPYTMGAFAFFGPGKFTDVYGSLTAPAADDRLHFAGEALSVRHAWVEGALDSAWRAIREMLNSDDFDDALLVDFLARWGTNPEWI